MRLGAKQEANEAVATATCSRSGKTGEGWKNETIEHYQ